MQRPSLPKCVSAVIECLNKCGYRADIVGGCVRDFLLGKAPSDYDVTTEATPNEMLRVFADFRTVPTGIKHGTLTVISDGEPIEVTTYRKDGEYKDHRRPESVTFTEELSFDLSRRDFTVNAICYNEKDGFTDLFGGKEDIEKRIIRAVGNPERRFDEDALRILRAIRFAATLGFKVEEKTAAAAKAQKHLLSSISGERIFAEWKKLIAGDFAYEIIAEFSDVISEFLLPGLEIKLPERQAFLMADSYTRQLSLFALSSSTPLADFQGAAKRMRFDNKKLKIGESVLGNLDFSGLDTERGVRLARVELGLDAVHYLIKTLVLTGKLNSGSYEYFLRANEKNIPSKISDLAVRGEDLKGIGIFGENIGKVLRKLLLAVACDEIPNGREALLEFAKK